MLRDFLVGFMGKGFGGVLTFYEQNALIINSVIVLYGFVMVFSWTTLVGIRRRLVAALVSQLRGEPGRLSEDRVGVLARRLTFPWEEAVSAARFPLVAAQSALTPRRRSVEAVQSLLTPESLVTEALEALRTELPPVG